MENKIKCSSTRWGKKSKDRGGGKKSKVVQLYTPLLLLYVYVWGKGWRVNLGRMPLPTRLQRYCDSASLVWIFICFVYWSFFLLTLKWCVLVAPPTFLVLHSHFLTPSCLSLVKSLKEKALNPTLFDIALAENQQPKKALFYIDQKTERKSLLPLSVNYESNDDKDKGNKAGYTATSCGWVGRGENARFPTFQLERDKPTNRQTDGLTNGLSLL